jgi:hypothetical protein
MEVHAMSSGSPRRFVQALAVTLPLGLDPAGDGGAAPRVALPPEIVTDAGSLGAVGLVFHPGVGSEVCAAVALRDGAAAPQLAALQWRPSAGPSRSTLLALERLPATETPAGFTVWFACAPAAAPAPGAALSALLVDPGRAAAPVRRRLDVPAAAADVWRWRTVEPVEVRAALTGAPEPDRQPVETQHVSTPTALTAH